jgi:hypothetical protein
MKIFISWSGQLSKQLGEVSRDWIPGVLQFVKPYFTPDDIEKGSRWGSEIARELQESQVGIIVLTRENLSEPWIMFEAGGLSKQLEKSRICPILFGLENTDLVGPLVQFQATSFTKVDMKKLVKTINNACGEERLGDNVLDTVFEMWWPKLTEQISSVMGKERSRGRRELRTDRELIEEILSLTRMSVGSREGEPEERIPSVIMADLFACYEGLKDGIESGDMDMIREFGRGLGPPIRAIERRFGGPALRRRVLREKAAGATGPTGPAWAGGEEREEEEPPA